MLKEGEILFKLLLRRLLFMIHLFADNNTQKMCTLFLHFVSSPHFFMLPTFFYMTMMFFLTKHDYDVILCIVGRYTYDVFLWTIGIITSRVIDISV
jgi:hypothetical protein